MEEVGRLYFVRWSVLNPSSYFLHKDAPIFQLHEMLSPFSEFLLHFLSIPSFSLFDVLVM